ncbi:hypothetical Protein YC6258_01572 [Gynuella sunshinyii YC6258]|uniref:Uncharacterized protein n=1 Tax=Gynuella sunshinyii YC6258 TaxID=1445510 RepID=A0A0C5V268_9GAMM|nr:hypothetical Protein YC6258_01572 [Gynuella sunshinyii YC6258]
MLYPKSLPYRRNLIITGNAQHSGQAEVICVLALGKLSVGVNTDMADGCAGVCVRSLFKVNRISSKC